MGETTIGDAADSDSWDSLVIRCAEVSHQLVEQGLEVPLPGAEPSGPRPPATPAQIDAAEARIGARLDSDARALLSRANGWVGLAGRFTLLSCEDIGGPDWAELIELRDIFFASCPPDSWPDSVVDPQVLIPIIVVPYSPETIYVFPSESNDGRARSALNTGLDPIPEITLKQGIEVSLQSAVADLAALAGDERMLGSARDTRSDAVRGGDQRFSVFDHRTRRPEEEHTTSITETHVAYAIEKIQCPSPDDLSKSLNITSPPLVTRQQGATQVSCLVVIPHGYMFSMLSLKNKGRLSDSVLPVLEEQAQKPSDRTDGRTTSSTIRPINDLGDEAYEMTTRFDDTKEVFEVAVWSRTGPYRVRVSGAFPDQDTALRIARLWVRTQPTQ